MIRGILGDKGYKPQFSGHETFPVRYGWIKKAYDAIEPINNQPNNKNVFLDDEAIANFGVGKNMVASIRHWATTSGIIREDKTTGILYTNQLWAKIFSANGLDPYMENPTTLWLTHWHLAGRPEKTTWYWVFNHFASQVFDRETLLKGLLKLTEENNWGKISPATIKRDVECFVRTYSMKLETKKQNIEDSLESPLTELGLIKPIGRRDGFRLVRGKKPSLGQGIFCWATMQFWQLQNSSQTTHSSTQSFEALAHEPGSPGKVFQLDETDLAERLAKLPDLTNGKLEWSEVAGLKQLIKKEEITDEELISFVEMDYAGNEVMQ